MDFDSDLKIPGHDFYLDAPRAVPCSFVSHAHSDHVRRHGKMVATPETILLCRLRFKSASGGRARAVLFGQPTKIDDLKIELFPAGHMLGAAQILVQLDDQKIVYTGDFNLQPGYTCPGAEVKPCDVLIMESTYGRPHYRFPEREKVAQQICAFIDAAFASRKIPVLLAYAVGKAQEVMKLLGDRGYKMAVHKSIFDVARVYQRCGVELTNYDLFSDPLLPETVLIFPPFFWKLPPVAKIENRRVAFLSGWGIDPQAKQLYHADEVFPFSDHADFADLVAYVQKANPKKIYTLHGFSEFAETLRRMGFDAEYLPESPVRKVPLEAASPQEPVAESDLFST